MNILASPTSEWGFHGDLRRYDESVISGFVCMGAGLTRHCSGPSDLRWRFSHFDVIERAHFLCGMKFLLVFDSWDGARQANAMLDRYDAQLKAGAGRPRLQRGVASPRELIRYTGSMQKPPATEFRAFWNTPAVRQEMAGIFSMLTGLVEVD